MIKIGKNKSHKNGSCESGGYTLLFAVLTSALVLGVAVFIVDLSLKQHELAVSARNSIYSFYAADSGIECYVNSANWNAPGFASSTGGTLNCGTGTAVFSGGPISGPLVISPVLTLNATAHSQIYRQTGVVSLSFNNGTTPTKACAQITITTGSSDSRDMKPVTVVDSRGYNLCTSGSGTVAPDATNASTVERALRLIQGGVW
ncbi:MAG: hypothetical protein NT077_02965 [Candidatus Taylorbacteria bacterium]|nr:hypothetical protein [Candidatus Taylorbacteria bacterium]